MLNIYNIKEKLLTASDSKNLLTAIRVKKLKSTLDGPHHYMENLQYECTCGKVHGYFHTANHKCSLEYQDRMEEEFKFLLGASGSPDPEIIQEAFKILGYQGHSCARGII